MSVEVEIKLKINSRTDIERVLEETGFVRADLVLESDTYYTSDHHDFAALDEAFRVRSTENRMTGKRSAAITYKGAKMDNISMTRQELETTVGDAKICRKILEHIGFRPVPPVEKLRQYFHRENITACVDTVTNLGDYLELEIIVETEEKKKQHWIRLKKYCRRSAILCRTPRELLICPCCLQSSTITCHRAIPLPVTLQYFLHVENFMKKSASFLMFCASNK